MSALEVLDQHGLLRESPAGVDSGTYGFTHGVVRRSVYDNLSEPRRRLMHWRIVQMLEGEANSSTSPAEVEHHAALAGEAATAARASVAAGRYCLRVYANGEALAFARRGLRHSEALPEQERVGLQIELMEVSLAARSPKDTKETARQLEVLAEQALSHGDVEHARLGFHLLSYIRWESGDWSDAKRHSLRAEFVARGADTREQIVAMAEAARCLALLERDLGQAEALALEARARATNAGFETVAIPDALGMLRFHQGAWDDAANLFQGARELSLRQGDRLGEFRALEHLIVLELERDRPEAARTLSRELVELAEKLREGSEAPFARCLAALAVEASGEDAARELDEGLECLRMADAKHRLAYALLRATHGDFRRGDIGKARARGEEALGLANMLERPSETAMAHVALLRCALASGDAKDIEHHRDALRRASMTQIASHVRREAEQLLIPKEGSAPWNS
jgi:predicted ATPase